jgi:hypothetical protein
LKLEGYNPTGTIFDRIAATARISGNPHVVDDGPLAASFALVTSTTGLPMTITQPTPALFGAMARALGAQDAEQEQSSGFMLNIDRVFGEIRSEIQAELGDQVRILIPVLPPTPANPASDFATQRLLAAMGILVDARSAAVVRQAAELPGSDPVAVVCLADGAIDQDGAF